MHLIHACAKILRQDHTGTQPILSKIFTVARQPAFQRTCSQRSLHFGLRARVPLLESRRIFSTGPVVFVSTKPQTQRENF